MGVGLWRYIGDDNSHKYPHVVLHRKKRLFAHQHTQVQYDLLNVLYGCKMALQTLDFSRVKSTIAILARGERALQKMLGRDSLGVTAKMGAHALRSRI